MAAAPWPRARLDAVGTVVTGGTPPTSDRSNYGHQRLFVSPADLGGAKYVRTSAKMLSDKGFSRCRRIPAGSTLFVCIGSTIGKVGLAGVDLATNQQINSIIPNGSVDPEFLFYATSALSGIVREQAGEQAVPLVNKSQFSEFEIPIPPLSEQRKIATALADADLLIDALERLIAKKQAVKRGMMQQLLTGRTRLPGYAGTWTPVRLRDVGSTYGGLIGKGKNDFGTGSAVFVTFMEVMAGARLVGTRLERVNVGTAERQNRVLRGDVLFNGSSETPEEVALAAVVDFDTSPHTYLNSFCFGYRLKDREHIDPTYLAYFFRSSQGRDIVSVLAQGATRYNIAKTKLMQVAPVLPPIDEQRAIVNILGDSEAEVDALDLRLQKARAIKTGMMQQLLTGRVRLPVEAVS